LVSKRFLGVIGVLWGAGILLAAFLTGGRTEGNSAYSAGQTGGLIFGALLLVVGLYYLAKSPGKSPN
jgi:hypothetical protein